MRREQRFTGSSEMFFTRVQQTVDPRQQFLRTVVSMQDNRNTIVFSHLVNVMRTSIVMMVFGKLYLSSLGYIFGSWEMVLGPFGYFLTLFAVWAAINAFNMVDGIDGLLGGLSCVSLPFSDNLVRP